MLKIEKLASPLPRPVLAAWERERLLVVDGEGQCWIDGRVDAALAAVPDQVALALSGKHAAARIDSAARVVVWDIETGASARIELGDAGPARGMTFVRRGAQDALAIVVKHALGLYGVDGRGLEAQPLRGFAAASLHGIADGASVAVLGREFAESRDTVAVFGVGEIPLPAGTLGERFRFREGLVDSSPTLAIGPAGGARAVVFRDPEGAEEPLEDDDPARVPREWCHHGFYVATLDGATLQRIESDLAVASGAPLCASASRIAAALGGGRIAVLSREGGETLHLELRWQSASLSGDRVLASAPDGTLRLIHLDA